MAKRSQFFRSLTIAVAGGETVRSAAEACGCAESTAYRICRTPEFKRRVSEIRTECTDAAVGRLTRLASAAVMVLQDIMCDKDQPAVARISAAKTLLATLGPLSELHELRGRLDELEANQKTNHRIVAA